MFPKKLSGPTGVKSLRHNFDTSQNILRNLGRRYGSELQQHGRSDRRSYSVLRRWPLATLNSLKKLMLWLSFCTAHSASQWSNGFSNMILPASPREKKQLGIAVTCKLIEKDEYLFLIIMQQRVFKNGINWDL